MSILLTLLAVCQSATPAPAFEVASVRLHEARGGRPGIATSGPRLTVEARTITGLIVYAYGMASYQIPETPALSPFGDSFYDITAKAEGDEARTTDEFRLMMRSLLAERFRLRFHREMREIPVYALIVAKGGVKLREAAPDADPTPHYAAAGRDYDVTIAKATTGDVIRAIENSLPDRPVLDQTGLTGEYQVRMRYTPNPPPNRKAPDPDDISIFTAVERLGLRLEPKKAMVEMLVVDSVEKPSAN